MISLELYIEGERVDLFKDETISITNTLKNVNDVTKVFTEFSQTFNLPASKTNSKIFKHYYNFNITNGFDARVRVPATIELNTLPFKTGFIKLEGVSLKLNKAHTYKVTFFGDTVSLKSIIGEDQLSDLNWLDNFNKNQNGIQIQYDKDNVRDYLVSERGRVIDGVIYDAPLQVPLLTHTQRLYYDSNSSTEQDGNIYYQQGNGHRHGVKWNELKFALKLPILIKAIEEQYTVANGYSADIKFSDDFFNNPNNDAFNDLYMWLHRTQGKVTNGGQIATFQSLVEGFPDSQGAYYLGFMTNNRLYFEQNDVPLDELSIQLNPASGFENVSYSVQVFYTDVAEPFYDSGQITGVGYIILDDTEWATNRYYEIQVTTSQAITFTAIQWYCAWDDKSNTFNAYSFETVEQIELIVRRQVPKMKVLDFITGLLKTFNLVTYLEDGIIVVKTLDDFYSLGNEYDITQYLDINKSQSDVALPFREIEYAYKGLKTLLADQHDQLFNEEWAKEKYTADSDTQFSGEIFDYTVPFEHLKFERLINYSTSAVTNLMWGWFVDDNSQSYIGEPCFFYMTRKTQTPFSYVDQVGPEGEFLNHIRLLNYFAPSNSNMNVTTFADQPSINFKAEYDEWENPPMVNTNTLFNNYHINYMSSIFNPKNRLTKVTVFLPLDILLNLKLNDRLIYMGDKYKINSIKTNYKNNKSDLELLND